jgi:hypothetical protein
VESRLFLVAEINLLGAHVLLRCYFVIIGSAVVGANQLCFQKTFDDMDKKILRVVGWWDKLL